MAENLDNIFRVIKEREKALQLLKQALEEMNPMCECCSHFDQYDKGGTCYHVCEWKHAAEARHLLESEVCNGTE